MTLAIVIKFILISPTNCLNLCDTSSKVSEESYEFKLTLSKSENNFNVEMSNYTKKGKKLRNIFTKNVLFFTNHFDNFSTRISCGQELRKGIGLLWDVKTSIHSIYL